MTKPHFIPRFVRNSKSHSLILQEEMSALNEYVMRTRKACTIPHAQRALSLSSVETLFGLKHTQPAKAAGAVLLPTHGGERAAAAHRDAAVGSVGERRPFPPDSNKLDDSHLIVCGRSATAYLPPQPQDTVLFLAHLAVQSVVSPRIISPELRETICLTPGIFYQIHLHTKSHLKG